MTYNTIRYDVDAGVATITLSRPGKLNAFTAEMMHELIDAFDVIDQDDEVRVVVVTGDGKAFCAGADLSEGVEGFRVGDGGELRRPDGSLDGPRRRSPRDEPRTVSGWCTTCSPTRTPSCGSSTSPTWRTWWHGSWRCRGRTR